MATTHLAPEYVFPEFVAACIRRCIKEHIVRLTDEVRQQLQQLTRSGTHSARVARRAQVLLKSDEGLTDLEIVEHVGCSERMILMAMRRWSIAPLAV